ncbi:MAG TPA: hypothetical protein DEQ34_05985, partial [Balneolaceae bacterium]|nr:hypothetical protein [Balneolaceae bacterium]
MKVYLSLLLLLLPCLSLSAQDLIFTTNKAKANDTNQYTAEVRELDFIRKMKRNNAFSFQIDGELYVQEIKTVTHKNGYVSIAAISPDGKNVTSVLSEKSGKLGGIIQVNGQAYSVFKVDEDYQFEEIREKEFACDFDDNLFTIGGHQKSADPGGTYANPT